MKDLKKVLESSQPSKPCRSTAVTTDEPEEEREESIDKRKLVQIIKRMEIERKKKDQREQMMDRHQDIVEPEGMKSQNQNLISKNKTL